LPYSLRLYGFSRDVDNQILNIMVLAKFKYGTNLRGLKAPSLAHIAYINEQQQKQNATRNVHVAGRI
jgi:hypothetical protein